MEQTFMTIHNLTPDANILWASDSIFEILGYQPQEVIGRSCFDYFHPREVPFARSIHNRGVMLDKAAVLHYARIMSRDGRWVSCECCFTVVHDVLVACTSIYRLGEKSERRAIEAPQVRRIFSCSPRDPRYHMLEHLSSKFRMHPVEREPRAALILNRFTRTLSIMFATEAIGSILGVPSEQVRHKSFYECIDENCLSDAFSCLESAKANDSIAYLRFWSRDPRRVEDFENEESEEDEEDDEDEDENDEDVVDKNATQDSVLGNQGATLDRASRDRSSRDRNSRRSSDSEEGGVKLDTRMDLDMEGRRNSPLTKTEPAVDIHEADPSDLSAHSRTASSMAFTSNSDAAPIDTPPTAQSSRPRTRNARHPSVGNVRRRRRLVPSVELEAVVSCTSDGLVVVLRRARPRIPEVHPPMLPLEAGHGIFAAPWAEQPIHPQYPSEMPHNFQSPLMPQHMPLGNGIRTGGPPMDHLMNSIRDVAVFAWAIVGINGNLASYSHGTPSGEAQPPDGLPVWDPRADPTSYRGPENQAAPKWARLQEQQQRRQEQAPYYSGIPSSSSFSGPSNYQLNSNQPWQPHLQQEPGYHPPHQPFGFSQHGYSSNSQQDGQAGGSSAPGPSSAHNFQGSQWHRGGGNSRAPHGFEGDYQHRWH